jgi:hypothetical protein
VNGAVEQDRECLEYLLCPGCGHVDVDFELVEYKVVRCFACGVTVRVTDYKVDLGPPGEPLDHVGLRGEVIGRPPLA